MSNFELRGLVGHSFFIFQERTCCRSMTSLFHHEKAVKLLGFIFFFVRAKIVCPFYFWHQCNLHCLIIYVKSLPLATIIFTHSLYCLQIKVWFKSITCSFFPPEFYSVCDQMLSFLSKWKLHSLGVFACLHFLFPWKLATCICFCLGA